MSKHPFDFSVPERPPPDTGGDRDPGPEVTPFGEAGVTRPVPARAVQVRYRVVAADTGEIVVDEMVDLGPLLEDLVLSGPGVLQVADGDHWYTLGGSLR